MRREELRIASSDGVIEVEGLVANPDYARIVKREQFSQILSAIRSSVYEIDLGTSVLPQPYILSFSYEEEWFGNATPEQIVLYYFDERVSSWRAHLSSIDSESHIVEAEVVTPATLWALGLSGPEDVPEAYEHLLNELISFPPPNAIGFSVNVSATEAEDFILLQPELLIGGCEGRYRLGQSETITSREYLSANVVYRVQALWQIANGCVEGEGIKPSTSIAL
jgi:hypothetical protein